MVDFLQPLLFIYNIMIIFAETCGIPRISYPKFLPMKRLTLYIFPLLLIMAICASTSCRKSKTYRIGVSQCSSDDWRNKMNEEIMREAMFHDNVEVEIRSADDSNERQKEDLRYFSDNDFDIIIASPNETKAITPVISEIMDEGTPVIVFDRKVEGQNYTAFQGADNDSIGYQAARYTNDVLAGKGKIIEILGNPASSPVQGRHDGFVDEIKRYPGLSIAASVPGYWNYNQAYRVADSLLRLFPDVEAVYAHNDRMAIAAADAAAKLKLSPVIIGVDAAPQIGMKAVMDGKIDATFLYPTEGARVIKTALAVLEGKPYDKVTELNAYSAVDKSNAEILIMQNQALIDETSKMEQMQSRIDEYLTRHNIQTFFLYLLLALLLMFLGVLFLFIRAYRKQKLQEKLLLEKNDELEKQRDMEKQLNIQLNEATQSKLIFFTNVSHDLRTPLTLIAQPIREVMEAKNLDAHQYALLRIADKNVRILQRLINQVLDFRKFENGHIEATLSEVDICALIRDWSEAFKPVARNRHIHLSVECPANCPDHLAIDTEKIERVFFNLLSNAFKYTPDNGKINVIVSFSDTALSISIADTGRGISAEDLTNIFDRFYQVDKVHPNGSGIGLSLAKAFVELHGGSLTAQSEPGKGSTFTVLLPVVHVAGVAEEFKPGISADDVAAELNPVREDVPAIETSDDNKPLILIIDDNADLQNLVAMMLRARYEIISAPNGAEGVRLAAKYVPDLVICDVMMPVMDGLECCRRIKSEMSTSHIPVLMLTACSMDEQRVQGYESGADGYVSKPFNADVLRSRVGNLIANRRRILDLYDPDSARCSLPGSDKRDGLPLPSGDIDNSFYTRFLEIFRRTMSNPDVSVDALAAKMGLGRSQFYRKIKALTNFSPVELIKNLRLKEARHLLLTTEKTVSEIAYSIGFSSPAYFTKCYRETFGETPSDTRTNLTHTT